MAPLRKVRLADVSELQMVGSSPSGKQKVPSLGCAFWKVETSAMELAVEWVEWMVRGSG